MIASYEARHIGGDKYVVYRNRWFGLFAPDSRIAIWDGYDYDGRGAKPDWFWESTAGKPSKVMAKGWARRALLREFERVMGRSPADWQQIPPARLLNLMLEEST